MSPRIAIFIEDDWELAGEGYGNVAHLQYLPATFLMNTCAELGIRCTFMADAMQQLVFRRHAGKDAEIRLQSRLWDDTVSLMKDRGFDVQLHVHPQWRTAKWKDGHFKVDRKWNLAAWPDEERRSMLEESIGYLRDLLRQVDSDYEVRAYKAGSWGLQPWGPLFSDLRAAGIRLVLGPRRGMHFEDIAVDYRGLEEETLPYHPDPDDIRKVSSAQKDVIVVPLAWYEPSLSRVAQLYVSKLQKRMTSGAAAMTAFSPPMPPGLLDGYPTAGPRATLREALRYATHLKIGDQPFGYLRRSFDDVLARVSDLDADLVVLPIESHTKQFGGNLSDIRRFLAYAVERQGHRVEFVDATGLLRMFDANPRSVRGGHAR